MPLQKAIYKHTLKNKSQTAFNLNEKDRSNWDKRIKNTKFSLPKEAVQKKSSRSSTLLGLSKYLEDAQTIFLRFTKPKQFELFSGIWTNMWEIVVRL